MVAVLAVVAIARKAVQAHAQWVVVTVVAVIVVALAMVAVELALVIVVAVQADVEAVAQAAAAAQLVVQVVVPAAVVLARHRVVVDAAEDVWGAQRDAGVHVPVVQDLVLVVAVTLALPAAPAHVRMAVWDVARLANQRKHLLSSYNRKGK